MYNERQRGRQHSLLSRESSVFGWQRIQKKRTSWKTDPGPADKQINQRSRFDHQVKANRFPGSGRAESDSY